MSEHLDDIAPGKGLMTQIKNVHKHYTASKTFPDLQEVVKAMQVAQEKKETQEALHQMAQAAYVTPHEYTQLSKMIDSPDYENFELAKGIMETKLPKENGITIARMGQRRELIGHTGVKGQELIGKAIHEELESYINSKKPTQDGNTIYSGDAQI